jgi:hypothetical protein
MNGLLFGVLIMGAGFGVYAATRKLRKRLVRGTMVEIGESA